MCRTFLLNQADFQLLQPITVRIQFDLTLVHQIVNVLNIRGFVLVHLWIFHHIISIVHIFGFFVIHNLIVFHFTLFSTEDQISFGMSYDDDQISTIMVKIGIHDSSITTWTVLLECCMLSDANVLWKVDVRPEISHTQMNVRWFNRNEVVHVIDWFLRFDSITMAFHYTLQPTLHLIFNNDLIVRNVFFVYSPFVY